MAKGSGKLMGRGPGRNTNAYPECPGPNCWCCDCARDSTGNDDDDDDEKHDARAITYAIRAKREYMRIEQPVGKGVFVMQRILIDHKPSLEDMSKITPRQYYIFDKYLYVNATCVSKEYGIVYCCPFCSDKQKMEYHCHGHGRGQDDNIKENRFEQRAMHCPRVSDCHRNNIEKRRHEESRNRRDGTREVRIAISEKTPMENSKKYFK